MVWLSLPIVIFSFVTREYWARIIFTQDNAEIALIFGWLCLGIFFRTLYAIVSRFYYAQKDTLTPLFVTVLGAFVQRPFLSWGLAAAYGVSGLGMATSLVAVLEIVVLVAIMQRRDSGLFHARFFKDLALILLVGLAAAAAAFLAADWLPLRKDDLSSEFTLKLSVIFVLTFALYFWLSRLLKIREAARLLNYVVWGLRKTTNFFSKGRART